MDRGGCGVAGTLPCVVHRASSVRRYPVTGALIVCLSGEIRAQREDANASVFSVREHRAVSGHDDLRAGRKGAFENSIVGLVGKNGQRFGWLDELAQLEKKDGYARERFAIVGKFSGKNAEQLIENGTGEGERVLAIDNPAKRLVASPAG